MIFFNVHMQKCSSDITCSHCETDSRGVACNHLVYCILDPFRARRKSLCVDLSETSATNHLSDLREWDE